MRTPALATVYLVSTVFLWISSATFAFSSPTPQLWKVSSSSVCSSSLTSCVDTLNIRGGGSSGSSLASVSTSSSIQDECSSNDSDSAIFRQAAVVGTITAAMGYVYGQILDQTVQKVWKSLPQLLTDRGISIGPSYITYTMAIGGLVMGILSKVLKPTYIVADFVSTMSRPSGDGAKMLTNLIPALPNLLILSLVTSTFGFSVGPEAPMVCAGGLVGWALTRKWYGSADNGTGEILTYAGAAGSLTAFMGIPLAGPIFALELTRASAGMTPAARRALGPAVAASAAALVLLRGIIAPNSLVGGHFNYGLVGDLSGRAAILTALLCGAGGAIIGTSFHKFVHLIKDILWKQPKQKNNDDKHGLLPILWSRDVIVKVLIGVAVGLVSRWFPQTMFWGEGSLQCVVDGHKTGFAATKHGLSSLLTEAAKVNPSEPFGNAWAASQVGLAKLLSISLACAGKFPGGIIFPLFFAAAPLAHSVLALLGASIPASIAPVAVMSLMAATQASVTRTPLATIFMLALSASPATELSKMLPSVILSSYVGVWFSRFLSKESYFSYS